MSIPPLPLHAADAPRGGSGRAGSALEAVRARRSWSRVTEEAPSSAELETLVAAAGRVADHSSLRPWRLIELRGTDRERLGRAINKALGEKGASAKPLRAPLLIAIVASYRESEKVPRWEQEAVASGVAHMLSLLLDEAGWGVIWRTGHYTRSKPVAKAHGLGKNEELLGWLYVGGKPAATRLGPRKGVNASEMLTRMPEESRRKTKKREKSAAPLSARDTSGEPPTARDTSGEPPMGRDASGEPPMARDPSHEVADPTLL